MKSFIGFLSGIGVLTLGQQWENAPLIGQGPTLVCASIPNPTGGGFIPGKYWEEKGIEHAQKGDASSALEAFKHAAYYGNRDAQYDIGMMYLKGAKKVAVDIPMGIAWLRVSAQYGQALSVGALVKLDATMTVDQHQQSDRHFTNLSRKYGVSATRPRVLKTYQLERGHIGFADYVCHDGLATPRDTYMAQVEQEFTQYVTTMFGKVVVEPIEPVPSGDNK